MHAHPETVLIEALNAPGNWLDNLHDAFPHYDFGVIKGPKYLKVFKSAPGEIEAARSVVCFVDRKTGEIRNAKSWKAPGRRIGIVRDWARD